MGHPVPKSVREEKQRTLIEFQKGAMDRFKIKEPLVSSVNRSVDPSTVRVELLLTL
jgi:hypothetical protein